MRPWVQFTLGAAVGLGLCGALAGLTLAGWCVLALFLVGLAVAAHDILGEADE